MESPREERTFRVFDERIEEYDEWFERQRIIYESELKLTESFPCSKPCIEIGVGTGRFAAPLGVETGIDPSTSALSLSAARGIEVVRGVAEHLPFRNESFRTAYLIVTLCFVNNPRKTLSEAARVLKHGGRLITCIVPLDSEWGQFYEKRKRAGESIFYANAVFYTREQVKSMLNEEKLNFVRTASVLRYSPGKKPAQEDPLEGEEGSFVCYESTKIS
ncbi:MAG: class I SAM-dependent methyltransferase [Fervidicoccaceae archaeon]